MDAFEAEWRDVMPDRCRHPSRTLIEMSQVAHNLAAADRFEQAHERSLEADRSEQREVDKKKHDLHQTINRQNGSFVQKGRRG
jgi:hypothetical protein